MNYREGYIKYKTEYYKLKSLLFTVQNGGNINLNCKTINGELDCFEMIKEYECSKEREFGVKYSHFECKEGEPCKLSNIDEVQFYCKPKDGPINIKNNTEFTFLNIDDYEVFRDRFEVKSGQIEEKTSAKNMLVKDNKVKWTLEKNSKDYIQKVWKLSEIFGMQDTIPQIYNVVYNDGTENRNDYVIEHVDFGMSHLEFLNKLKTKTGALGLLTVLIELKNEGEDNINKFVDACDIESFQRMLLFAVIINHRDFAARNVMLKYEEGKIKFKLIDFESVFVYGTQVVNFSLLISGRDIVLNKLKERANVDNLISKYDRFLFDKLDEASEVFNDEDEDKPKFKNVLKHFIENHIRKDNVVEQIKDYYYEWENVGQYEYLFIKNPKRAEAIQMLKDILQEQSNVGKNFIANKRFDLYVSRGYNKYYRTDRELYNFLYRTIEIASNAVYKKWDKWKNSDKEIPLKVDLKEVLPELKS